MYRESEKEVHQYLDEYFATHDVWTHDDDHLSRFHRSWVRKNSDKFYINKVSEIMTGQPIYRYGNKTGTQYGSRGKHIGWGGSYWSHTWQIRKRNGA
jgi:hypothetical protein